MSENIIIVFDTETTGFSPKDNEIVQLSYILYDTQNQKVIYSTRQGDDIVRINGKIPQRTTEVHGIKQKMTLNKLPIKDHIDKFIGYCSQAGRFVGHNISFDIKMIVGQIHKILPTLSPEEKNKYNLFLSKFQMVGKDLPDTAFCTMEESKGICAQLRRTNKLKKEKLMEVHKLLFNQDVGGQLHNALVDISVTLRVFLKLTMDIDICQSMTKIYGDVNVVTNNNELCNLINPVRIDDPIENVDFSGELITGLTILPKDSGIKEDKIMVQSIYRDLATTLVNDAQQQAMTNVLNKNKVVPSQDMCTELILCQSILGSGANKGQVCRRVATYGTSCRYHKPKEKKQSSKTIQPSVQPSVIEPSIQPSVKPSVKPVVEPSILDKPISQQSQTKGKDISTFSTHYVKSLFKNMNMTRKNKVVPDNQGAPLGGKRTKKTKKRRRNKKRTKKIKKRRKLSRK